MVKESSDRPPSFGTIYSGPAMRSLIDILHLRSVSRSSSHILARSSVAICNTGLFQGSRKLSLAFQLMPGCINKFKKSVLHPETFESCLNRKNGCFDRSHLVCGIARPQGWGTASLLGLISFFLPPKKNPHTYLSSGHGSVIVRTRKTRFDRLIGAQKK